MKYTPHSPKPDSIRRLRRSLRLWLLVLSLLALAVVWYFQYKLSLLEQTLPP
ncbi:hypothetical protein IC229_29710 [Spirosoma sp. BT702]|uniref:Uncharacterized protein n=1 Tax=Spirosoma profusum TaxID=2771354 RepID=A0A927GA69_9BACT|nr:hypothetical protein [Spirosoma profusum]MBD2704845.1 hypothetical protein [Spirosoma profusum]